MKKSCIKASIIVLITVFISLSVMPISVFAEESDTSEALSEVQTNSEGNERYYLGETIKAGDDDGYDKDKTIKKKDPHYGWTLGDFYITGFSRVIAEDEETPVFLKNVGDTPTLYFKLNQDIDELDGDDDNVALVETSTTGTVKTYNLRIVYDPTSTGTTFTCINTATQYTIFSSSLLFPDIDELKNLKVTIGYAVNASGNPYRYSNITVHNFDLKKLKNVANPTITCENNVVTIDCDTVGANVYYRLNLSGDYSAYTTSFTITADTVVQAYATYNGETSEIIREDCEYGLEKPVI